MGGGSVTGGSTVRYLAANLIDIKYLPVAHLLECFSVARQCSHTTSTATATNTQRVGMQHEPASTLTKRTFNQSQTNCSFVVAIYIASIRGLF